MNSIVNGPDHKQIKVSDDIVGVIVTNTWSKTGQVDNDRQVYGKHELAELQNGVNENETSNDLQLRA
jgi:hypothetical protein